MRSVAIAAAVVVLTMLGAGVRAGEGLNPYKGRQSRAEKFEFAAKPAVRKQGGKYVITFASRAACDATVAVVDPGGRIVRHLASGVLGKNAPWPFKQGSLSQSIEWDGKDDLGKASPAGCRVKVGLGLKASLDRFLGWSQTTIPIKHVAGVACGPGGEIFVLNHGQEVVGRHNTSLNVYVFARDGKYLRRLLPPPAHLPPEKSTVYRWAKTTWGGHAPLRSKSYIMHSVARNYAWVNVPLQTPLVMKGKFMFLVPNDRQMRSDYSLLRVDTKDGSTPPGSITKIKFEKGVPGAFTTLHLAGSPDGKWLYIGGGSDHYKEDRNTHAVWRMSLSKPGRAKLFLGNRSKPGKGDKEFNHPRGMACDKAGNLYVADSGNNRLQVFKPDGSLFKSIPAKAPERVAVSLKTGAIYLLRDGARQLVVLGGLNDPSVKAQTNSGGSTRHPLYVPGMALDEGSSPAGVWLSHCSLRGLNAVRRVELRGAKFADSARLGAHAPKHWRKQGWLPWSPEPYIVADRFREELYVRNTGMCGTDRVFRVDGRTGKLIEVFDMKNAGRRGQFEECVVGPQGLVWMRLTQNGQYVAPYDPEKRAFLNRSGYRQVQKLSYRGKPVMGFRTPHGGTGFNFTYPMGIAPNGDLYVPCKPTKEFPELAGTKGWNNKNHIENFYRQLRVYSGDGKLKCRNALPGLGATDGLRIGRSGAVYMVMSCQPRKQKLPDGIADRFPGDVWGTLVKFDSVPDKYPIGKIDAVKSGGTHRWGWLGARSNVRIEGMAWDYGGVGPVPMYHCHCWKSTFDLDAFERSFVPAAPTCTVNVLDANGNVVVRLGGYGNADSMGKDSPVIDPKTGALRPRRKDEPKDLKSPLEKPELGFVDPSFVTVTDEAVYVHDRGNERIVRAKLGYHAEETVSLSWASASVRTSPAPKLPETAVVSAAPAGGKASAGRPAAGSAGKRPVAENKQIVMARKCKHWINMAKNYTRAGMSGKAREYLRKVISGYPQSSFADSARKRLQALR